MSVRLKLREVANASRHDPKAAILDSLGGRQEGFDVYHANIIAATYIAPPLMFKGPNGNLIPFERTDKGLTEDRYQGKAFLVLKMGPLAFTDDNIARFGGKTPKVGDWVMAKTSDGMEFYVVDDGGKAGTSCRVFKDVDIIARLDDPALVY